MIAVSGKAPSHLALWVSGVPVTDQHPCSYPHCRSRIIIDDGALMHLSSGLLGMHGAASWLRRTQCHRCLRPLLRACKRLAMASGSIGQLHVTCSWCTSPRSVRTDQMARLKRDDRADRLSTRNTGNKLDTVDRLTSVHTQHSPDARTAGRNSTRAILGAQI